jgi:hypothetical protein
MHAGQAWRVNTPTHEDAAAVSRKNLLQISVWDMVKDAARLGYLFHKWYFGFEPKSVIQDILSARKLKKAVTQCIRGHKDTAGGLEP